MKEMTKGIRVRKVRYENRRDMSDVRVGWKGRKRVRIWSMVGLL